MATVRDYAHLVLEVVRGHVRAAKVVARMVVRRHVVVVVARDVKGGVMTLAKVIVFLDVAAVALLAQVDVELLAQVDAEEVAWVIVAENAMARVVDHVAMDAQVAVLVVICSLYR